VAAEPMVDGVPLAKAFRHREIMLLQAVAEKYGKVSLRMGGNIVVVRIHFYLI
jgi:hypothetical protein